MVGKPIVNRTSRYSRSVVDQESESGSSGSDSDSGNSIFITQNPARKRRQRRSAVRSRGPQNGHESIKKREKRVKLPPFTLDHFQEGKHTRLVLNKIQNVHYHNALIGGFFFSVRQLEAHHTRDLLSSLPTVDQEGDFITPIPEEEKILDDQDVTAKKKDLVVFSKTKRPQPWYVAPRVNRQSSHASKTSHEGFGRSSCSGSRNGNTPGNKWTGNNQTPVQAAASKRLFQQEEMQDKPDSDSDATVCELPEEDAQYGGGASPAGAQLQPDEQEEPEAQNDDFQSQKEKELNVSLGQTEQVDESRLERTEASEVKDKRIKKKKKKRQPESEENCIDGSFSKDAISLPGSQEMMVDKKSFDGCTAGGDKDSDTQLVMKKKKRKTKRQPCLNICIDTVTPQCEESVSVQKTKKKKQTSSCITADAGTSTSESAQTQQLDEVKKKQKKKKKKKKKKHQSESEENYIDGSFSKDAIGLPGSQEFMVDKKSFDGCTAGGDKDSDTQLVMKKKKRKKKRQPCLNICSDTVTPQCEESVQKTKKKKQTSSCTTADAGTSTSESAQTHQLDEVKKKKTKKRKLEAAASDGKLSETLQLKEAKRKKREQSAATLRGVSGCDAEADFNQTVEEGVVKKKKKKNTEGVPPAESQHIHSEVVSCSFTAKGHNVSPDTHSSNAPKKRRKRKSESQTQTDSKTEAAERERTEVAAGFTETPAVLQKPSNSVTNRKNKRTLHNPSEDFFTDW